MPAKPQEFYVLHLPTDKWYGAFPTYTAAGLWADKTWPCGPTWVYLGSVARKLGMTEAIAPEAEK